MTIQELHENTIDLCSRLIQAKSYSGEEREVVGVIEREMRRLGYDEVTVDEYGNVIGCLRGRRPGPRVLLDGHIDTVPVQEPERWSFDPFGGEIRDDRVCGRGASDMKGAVAAMICAAAAYAQEGFDMFEMMINGIKEEFVKFCYNVTVQTTTQRKNVLGSGEGRKDEYEDEPMEAGGQQVPDQAAVPKREHKQETVRRDAPKVGRNDPCPCGSGKKYKHCCGRNQ